jgi:alpha-1,2-mannosyltransferase
LAADRVIIAAVVFLIGLVLIATRINPCVPDSEIRYTTDLATFVAASRAVSADVDPYDVVVLKTTVADSSIDVLPYVYTPVVAQLLAPFNGSSVALIQRWWLILSTASMSIFIIALMTFVQHRTWTMAALLAAALPVHFALVSGQIEAFLALMITGAIWAHLRGHTLAAGLLLGSAIVVKHAIVFLLLWFIIERGYRTLMVTTTTAVVAVAISVLASGTDVWFSFLHFAGTMTYDQALRLGFEPAGSYNLSVSALLLRIGMSPAVVFRWAGPVFLAIVTAGVLWRRNITPLDQMQSLTIMSLAAVLALPFTWSHHLLYAGLAFATIFARALSDRTTKAITLMTVAVAGSQIAPGMPIDRALRMINAEIPVVFLGSAATLCLIGTIILAYRTPLLRPS